MLLRSWLWSSGVRSSESTEQSVDDNAGGEQLPDGGQRWILSFTRDPVQIGPGGRDQRPGAVWQDDEQLHLSLSLLPSQHFQSLAVEGMALPGNGYSLRVEVVVGSVSCLPSTLWTTRTCGGFSTRGYATACCDG